MADENKKDNTRVSPHVPYITAALEAEKLINRNDKFCNL